MVLSSNFSIQNMNLFFHLKIELKHEINSKIRSEKTEDLELKLFFLKLFKEKKKKISFNKNGNKNEKEIKYFKHNNLYIYSQKFNKSNLFYNFFINFQNKVSIVDKIYQNVNDEIMLNITSSNGEKYTINKNQIQNQVLCIKKNWFVSLNEPNWLI
jgi:hypothetical protein